MVAASMPLGVACQTRAGGSGFASTKDADGRVIELDPVRRLLDRIVAEWSPNQIWLFGSRARGEARAGSDWDLFVVVPDEVPDAAIGPVPSWRLGKESGARADVLPCHAREFADDRETLNTLAYSVVREGVLLYER
jgi:predicted nucleotidyltransferase